LGISFRSMRYRLERLGMERENGAEEGGNAGSDAEE
jgi:hypothetical protein